MNLEYTIKQLNKDFKRTTFVRCCDDIDVYSLGKNEYYLIFKEGILNIVLQCIFEDEFGVMSVSEFLQELESLKEVF